MKQQKTTTPKTMERKTIDLIPLGEKWRELIKGYEPYDGASVVNAFEDYVTLSEQPLSLGVFVPCKDGKVLNEPAGIKSKAFIEAESRLIFEGWSVVEGNTSVDILIEHKEMNYKMQFYTDGVTITGLGRFGRPTTIEDLMNFGLKVFE